MDNKVQEFWNRFLEETGRDKNCSYIECFSFDLSERVANELLELTLSGKKTATCSSVDGYKLRGEVIPGFGDLSIVTNWNGEPKCVIETTKITILPFKDVTYDICKREGEDDNLESWRQGHIKFFKAEGKEVGYEFSDDMKVVFEDFKVVYRNR